MPQGRGKDEFDHLANNLNEMLDQIESLMNGVRSVSDSIAHDLRTPLTRLRGRLEQLKDPSQDDWHSMVEGSIEEADRMIATFNALLRIAEIEAGNRRKSLEVVNMKSLLQDITDLYEPLAAEKTIIFSYDLPAIQMLRAIKICYFRRSLISLIMLLSTCRREAKSH